jgi:hypothetical protein
MIVADGIAPRAMDQEFVAWEGRRQIIDDEPAYT